MKQPNPLLPQGSFEAHARGKSHVRIAVFTILAIHVVVLGALLIQGCKRDDAADPEAGAGTNEIPSFASTSSPEVVTPTPGTTSPPPVDTSSLPPTAATTPPPVTAATSVPPAAQPPVPATLPPVTPQPDAGALIEHTIVRGDTLSGLASKYGVSVRGIQSANPTIDPSKLQVGQKVKIPPKTVTPTANGTATAESADTYTVRSGDTLGRIATANGTTVRALQKLNNLTTTQIRVGQKLKLPPRTAPAPSGSTAPAPTPGTPAPAQ